MYFGQVNPNKELFFLPFAENYPETDPQPYNSYPSLINSFYSPVEESFVKEKETRFRVIPNFKIDTRGDFKKLQSIQNVIQKILMGKTEEAFIPRSEEIEARLEKDSQDGLGNNANRFIDLAISECACRLFDRFRTTARTIYEDNIISKIMKKIKDQSLNGCSFNLHLVLYMPGKCASEVIFLTRLAQEISKQGFSGNIDISIIDPAYKGIVSNQKITDPSFSHAVNEFKLFLEMLSLKTNINFSTLICFKSAEEYQATVNDIPDMAHDFFMGSDLGGIKPPIFGPVAFNTRRQCCERHESEATVMYGRKIQGREEIILWENDEERIITRKIRAKTTPVAPLPPDFFQNYFTGFKHPNTEYFQT